MSRHSVTRAAILGLSVAVAIGAWLAPAVAQAQYTLAPYGQPVQVYGPPPTPLTPLPPETPLELLGAEDGHRGFFFRLSVGLGYGQLFGDESLQPIPGVHSVAQPDHHGLTLGLAPDIGGGIVKNLALHVSLLYERILVGDSVPRQTTSLFGIGGGVSYYLPHDFYATLHVRLLGLLAYYPDASCESYFEDKFEGFRGPGVALTLGKEWFGDDDGGVGLGLVGHYARLHNETTTLNYASVLFALTLSHF